ncbi:MAG: hypothetical protein O9308_08585 [Beijerinckiaceae bacterium]|jgi:hypothetical protein|nr:hypothetical protein [Beijerinckiaceae bacterium]
MRIVTGLASVVLMMGLGQGAASAQQANAPAAAPAAPRTASRAVPKNAAEIVLANARSGAVVTGLSVTSAAGKSVATLKKPLEPGKKITIKLPKNSGCTFAVNASFSDDAEFDQTDVNLCTDKTVRFTD